MNIILLILSGLIVRYAAMLKHGTAWFDESFSVHFSSMPIEKMLGFLVHDVHPPLHAILLNGWFHLFGANIVSARWLSIFFGVAAIPVMVRIGARFGKKVGIIAGIITAFSPTLITYSVDARMYSLLFFLIVIATEVFLQMLEGKKKAHVIWGVSIGLALFTHITALIPLGVMSVYGWFFLKSKKSFIKTVLISSVPAVVWMGFFTFQRIGFGTKEWQLTGGSVGGSIIQRFADVFVHGVDPWIRGLLLPLLLVLLLGSVLKMKRHVKASYLIENASTISTRFLFISALLPFLVFFPLHATTTKYLYVGFPALILLIAIGIKRVFGEKNIYKVIGIYLLIVASPIALLVYERRIQWDDALAYVESEEIEGDILYASWFASELSIQQYYKGNSEVHSIFTYDESYSFEDKLVRHAGQQLGISDEILTEMEEIVSDAPHVFLVTGDLHLQIQPVLRWYFEHGWRFVGEYKPNNFSPAILKLENPKK